MTKLKPKYDYKVNPEFVVKVPGKKIIEAIVEDLDQLQFRINDLIDLVKAEKEARAEGVQLLSDAEAIQDMLKLALKKKKF